MVADCVTILLCAHPHPPTKQNAVPATVHLHLQIPLASTRVPQLRGRAARVGMSQTHPTLGTKAGTGGGREPSWRNQKTKNTTP